MVHFPHNYNYVTRCFMYSWFNRHLELGFEDPILEEDYQPLSREDQNVWNDEHPAPPGGEAHERQLTQTMARQAEGQLADLKPVDKNSFTEFVSVVGGAWQEESQTECGEKHVPDSENQFHSPCRCRQCPRCGELAAVSRAEDEQSAGGSRSAADVGGGAQRYLEDTDSRAGVVVAGGLGQADLDHERDEGWPADVGHLCGP